MDFTNINKIKNETPAIILARHAERDKVKSLITQHEALLTEKGISDARIFGEHIAGRFDNIRIFHSPVERCRQTAESIYNGIIKKKKDAILAGEQQWLAGQYLLDLDFIDKYIIENGTNNFLRAWFDDKFPANVAMPLEETASGMMSSLLEQLKSNNCLIIDITHDWDMSALLEHYMKLKHEDISTPGFLDHIIISGNNGRVSLKYHEYTAEIS